MPDYYVKTLRFRGNLPWSRSGFSAGRAHFYGNPAYGFLRPVSGVKLPAHFVFVISVLWFCPGVPAIDEGLSDGFAVPALSGTFLPLPASADYHAPHVLLQS